MLLILCHNQDLEFFIICVQDDSLIPENLIGEGPCWLHNSAAEKLGHELPGWIWWKTEKPSKRSVSLKDIVEKDIPFDKDKVLDLVPERHKEQLNSHKTVYATGYRRTRNIYTVPIHKMKRNSEETI